MRSNSHGDLYPFFSNSSVQAALSVVSNGLWHLRLGHASNKAVSIIARDFLPNCNNDMPS
uniref:GAG-pre-integrase domain-containing protein n=1 Tax=Triticum urartu TaxID=4572 RepID=A0A8R7P6C8_TRIUA